MPDEPDSSIETPLDMADRQMLAEIKASVLGTPQPEFQIGRFRVIRRIGEGAMGAVFEAVDAKLQRRVAIKLLHQQLGSSDQERKARMLREAQVLAQLAHPHVVQVYEAGEHDGQVFMAMELVVDGRSLHQYQSTAPDTTFKDLLGLYIDAGKGLGAAHTKGLVHRDFKPHNVLVDKDGWVRVVDFGLARGIVGVDQWKTDEAVVLDGGAIERQPLDRLTATGAVPGTPAYMAPELFEGERATALSDQFSFCVALYEAVAGCRPFVGTRLPDLISAIKSGRISAPVGGRAVPKWLLEVVARGLAPEPACRFPSMDALVHDLQRDRAAPWRRGAIGLALVVVAGAAWWAGGSSQPVVRGLETHEPLMAARRRAGSCRADVRALERAWAGAKAGVIASAPGTMDTDELDATLDAGATRLFERMEGICLQNAEGYARCLDPLTVDVRATLSTDGRTRPNTDLFHELLHDYELCLEAGPAGCGSARSGSPAIIELNAARAAEHDGTLDVALAHLANVARLTQGRDERLTNVRAALRKAAIYETRSELAEARAILDRALLDAFVCEADALALDVLLERIETEVLHRGDEGWTEHLLEVAFNLLESLPSSSLPLRHARLLEKQGGARLYLDQRCEEALQLFEQSLVLRGTVIEDRREQGLPTILHERLAADAELNIANAHYEMLVGDWESCPRDTADPSSLLELYRHARERFAGAVEDDLHLGLAEFELGLAIALLANEQPVEAVAQLDLVLAIYERNLGANSVPSADIHLTLAQAHRIAGDLVEAKKHARTAVAVRLSAEPGAEQRVAVAMAHDALGVVLHEMNELAGAHRALMDAVRVLQEPPFDSLSQSEREQLFLSSTNLAMLAWDRGDRAESEDALARALEVQRQLQGRVDIIQLRIMEARFHLARGHHKRALARLRGAETLPGANPVAIATVTRLRRAAGRRE